MSNVPSIRVVELLSALLRDYEQGERRAEIMSKDGMDALVKKRREKSRPYDYAIEWLAKRLGCDSSDVADVAWRARHGNCIWGYWRREGHGDDWPDIRSAAQTVLAADERGVTAELLAHLQEKYPSECKAMGLRTAEAEDWKPRNWFTTRGITDDMIDNAVRASKLRRRGQVKQYEYSVADARVRCGWADKLKQN